LLDLITKLNWSSLEDKKTKWKETIIDLTQGLFWNIIDIYFAKMTRLKEKPMTIQWNQNQLQIDRNLNEVTEDDEVRIIVNI
jgi:hypothetical protein